MARLKLLPGHITFIGVYCNERIIFQPCPIKITGAYQNNIAVKVSLIAMNY
jgi:hypothetical protein